ncbi:MULTISPECIES: hypothetical protein [Stutzerimonas]|uniref:hypothetical protein n=1 Tax=Stutzerimonas TaxID=2901164 RepID=UPI0012E12B2D|nr:MULTISPECIES: hypothetical protein [Stutzerimonas]MUT72912.1 hypothetical protein [Stutzerimonas frequens]WAE63842.1 hypothetical protein OUY36_09900 [Stutzerimonas sp. R40042]
MSIRSLTIGKRPTLGFGLIGLLVLFLGLFAMNQMANMREEAGRIRPARQARSWRGWR